MGSRIRLFEPGIVYNVTQRTNDRCFLFKPNHHPQIPLLQADSPPHALDVNNEIIPKPSVINIIGSSLVRAMHEYPIELFWYELNINHNHVGVGGYREDVLDDFIKFFQLSNSLIARQLNKTWYREGHLFGSRYRMEPCIDDPAAEQKLEYGLTNVVKDHLVERVDRSPFFSTYKHLAYGKPLKYWWIDWAGYWKAGGGLNSKLHPKQFLKWGELNLSTLPGWENLTIHQRQTRVRKMAQAAQEEAADIRKREKRTVVGVPALYAVDPRDRPKAPKKSGPQPLCHASDRKLRRDFKTKWNDFLDEYKEASQDFRDGYWEREFPDGSVRPPILKIYFSSKL